MKYEVTNNDFRQKAFATPDGVKIVEPGETATIDVSNPIGEVEGLDVKPIDAPAKKAAKDGDTPAA